VIVQQQHAAAVQVLVETLQRKKILLATYSYPKYAADNNGLLGAWQIKFVQRLLIQTRPQPLALGLFPTQGEHIWRHITAINIQTCP